MSDSYEDLKPDEAAFMCSILSPWWLVDHWDWTRMPDLDHFGFA